MIRENGEDPDRGGRILLNWGQCRKIQDHFMWLRIGTTGSLLPYKTKTRFAQYLDKFLTDGLVTYQDGLSSKELSSLVVSETKCFKDCV